MKEKNNRLKKILRFAAVVVLLLLMYNYLLLPRMLTWGAAQQEVEKYYPGGERIRHKGYKNTLAVTVHANPSEIWPWVAQMGLNKGGFYSYTTLENLFGCQLVNADYINPAWLHPKVGDVEPVCRSQEGKPGSGWQIGIVKEHKALVWYGLNNTANSEWMMGIYIDSIDRNRCRLVTRQQFSYPKTGSADWVLEKMWFEWAHCIMQNGMLRGIKKRVENYSKQPGKFVYEPHMY